MRKNDSAGWLIIAGLCLIAVGLIFFLMSRAEPIDSYAAIEFEEPVNDTMEKPDLVGTVRGLLLLNGVDISEEDIAKRFPTDIDDPIGAMYEAIRYSIPVELTVMTGKTLAMYIPGPSIVWLDDGPHILIHQDEGSATFTDGSWMGFSKFSEQYAENGGSFLYICQRGYDPEKGA